jgi:hypothetical protein
MIRVVEIEPPKVAVVHAPKRKTGRYLDPAARQAYRAAWMRRRRAAKLAKKALANSPNDR